MSNLYLNDSNTSIVEVLFRSGFGLQARELNALQKSLKRQISAVADNIFDNGSPMIGGSLKLGTSNTVLVESNYLSEAVELDQFVGKTIVELDSEGSPTGAQGLVIAVSYETDTESAAIHYDDTTILKIGDGEELRTADSSYFATIKTNESPIRDCSVARLSEGVFYYNKTAVAVDAQLAIFSKFDSTYSGYVGLEFKENIITEFDDNTLYDPARGYRNYNAPGAHRRTYTATLTTRGYTDSFTDFVILAELQSGAIKSIVTESQLNELGDIIAEGIYDASGDFVNNIFSGDLLSSVSRAVTVVEPSTIANVANVTTAYPHNYNEGDTVVFTEGAYAGSYNVREILNTLQFSIDLSSTNGSTQTDTVVYRSNYFGVQMSAGKAYVKGYAVTKPTSSKIEIPRALTTDVAENVLISTTHSQYVMVTDLVGLFDVSNFNEVVLRDSGSNVIGSARVKSIIERSSTSWELYLFDISIDSGNSQTDIVYITSSTALSSVDASATVDGTFSLIGADAKSLIFPVTDYTLATTAPDGIETTSYVAQVSMSDSASGGIVTFTAPGSRTFVGPLGSDFAGTSTFETNYTVVDSSTGDVLTPTSAVIDSSGQTLTLDVGVSNDIVIVANVNVRPAIRTKTKTTSVILVPSGNITSVNRTYSLNLADIISVSVESSSADITSNFTLDTGQRDAFYDFGTITLKNSSPVPTGAITVTVEYYKHSGSGYFSVDSYSDETIPTFKSPSTGETIELRNVLDFRPRRTTSGMSTNLIPSPTGTASLDFLYYLGRRDIITMSKDGDIRVKSGIPAIDPVYPSLTADEMALFNLDIEPLTDDVADDVTLAVNQNIRYTMKDIGGLAKRISRLEYETSLSLLEVSAKQTDILDSSGSTRFKTGFLVDNFTAHGLGDTTSSEYQVAIDRINNICRPTFFKNITELSATNLNNVSLVGNDTNGYFLMMPYTTTSFVSNLIASKGVSVTAYLTAKRKGTLVTSPSSDYWVDTTTAAVNNVDVGSDYEGSIDLGTSWDDWETTWTGVSSITAGGNTVTTTTTDSTRTGTAVTVTYTPTTTSIGSSVVDVDVSQYMRAIDIMLTLTGMRADTDLHVFIDSEKVDSYVSDPSTEPVGTGVMRTDSSGNASATLSIPAGTFFTGDRVITVSDETNNVSDNATTEASYIFSCSGLITTEQETTVTTRTAQYTTEAVSETQTTSSSVTTRNDNDDSSGDPYAHSFYVSKTAYPNGMFIAGLNLYFRRKPTDNSTGGVKLQLRPMVNGYPSSDTVVPMSELIIPWEDVNIPEQTESMDSILDASTRVDFPVPIYLEADASHCIVLISDSSDFEVYVAEMGENILGTSEAIYTQPTLGSSFRSQNGSTWTAFQNDNLMFSADIAVFDTSAVGEFDFEGETKDDEVRYNLLNLQNQLLEFTSSTVEYTATTVNSTTLGSSTYEINTGTNVSISSEQIIQSGTSGITFGVSMQTSDPYTSPYFDLDRQYAILIGNNVNYYGIVHDGLLIESGGSGYSSSPTITVDSSTGSGAVLSAVVESGIITDITVVNPGTGYTEEPTITVTDTTGSGASITFTGFETDAGGGNALARYITKPITLGSGFETDQANCYVDLSLPTGTWAELYVRSVADSDGTSIELRPWTLVTDHDMSNSVNAEFIETKFEIPLGYTGFDGGVFDTVNTVQAKIVLLSSNTSKVPQMKNFRLITTI